MQVQAIPEDAVNDESEDEDKVDKDERMPQSEKVCVHCTRQKYELV